MSAKQHSTATVAMRWRAVKTRSPAPRWLGGLLTSVAMVAAVTGVVALLEQHVPVLSLLVLYLLAVLPVAVMWGPRLAALTSVLSVTIFAVFLLPPQGSLFVADSQSVVALGVFLVTAMVVAELAARSRRAAMESMRLAEEQSALRRVATLVAHANSPPAVFEAVTREVGLLCGADLARMERYEADGTVTGVAAWSRVPVALTVGTHFDLDGLSVARDVQRTGRPVRLESFADATGSIAREARTLGIRSSVGCPITVAGRLWGVIAASTKSDPFPANIESQIARFTELVSTAVENAEARAELHRMADEQAALRRVATLVAHGVAPGRVFDAVAREVARLTDADTTSLFRFEPDGTATFMASHGWNEEPRPHPGENCKPELPSPTASVLATGESARYDEDSTTLDAHASVQRDWNVRSSVASPIIVEGRCWGAISVASRRGPFAPETEQRMVEFTEIVASAIANAESRAQLAASRARVVAAGDGMRRRLERDLHDGAQQRLVSVMLDLRLVQETLPAELPALGAAVGEAADQLGEALEELREMSHGLHPAILSQGGLGPALRTIARRSTVPVELRVATASRYPAPAEVAAYYVVSEALTNTAKHAQASHVEVSVDEQDRSLRLRVYDDGVGGADPHRGSGLIGLRDRVEALGGTIDVTSPAGKGTIIQVSLPLESARVESPAAGGTPLDR